MTESIKGERQTMLGDFAGCPGSGSGKKTAHVGTARDCHVREGIVVRVAKVV